MSRRISSSSAKGRRLKIRSSIVRLAVNLGENLAIWMGTPFTDRADQPRWLSPQVEMHSRSASQRIRRRGTAHSNSQKWLPAPERPKNRAGTAIHRESTLSSADSAVCSRSHCKMTRMRRCCFLNLRLRPALPMPAAKKLRNAELKWSGNGRVWV